MRSDSRPVDVRELIRKGEIEGPTSGMCLGYVQANLVVLSKDMAYDFLLFCQRNPKPCPLLDVTEVGSPEPKIIAPGADLRYELSRYRIYKNGELVGEVGDIAGYWREDSIAFLLGCSFTFEGSLMRSGIPMRHIEEGHNVPMYITDIECYPSGTFSGPMVVSMRPVLEEMVVKAVQITSKFPRVHGAPIHIGNPEGIGIVDLNRPDFGEPVTVKRGEIPLFWACGVTTQVIALRAKPEIMMTHSPGHMFISDILNEEYSLL